MNNTLHVNTVRATLQRLGFSVSSSYANGRVRGLTSSTRGDVSLRQSGDSVVVTSTSVTPRVLSNRLRNAGFSVTPDFNRVLNCATGVRVTR